MRQQLVVPCRDRFGRLVAFSLFALGAQLFECVGDAGECGDDDQYACTFGTTAGDQLQDVLPAWERGDTGAAELHHDPGGVRGKRREGLQAHEISSGWWVKLSGQCCAAAEGLQPWGLDVQMRGMLQAA